MAYYINHINDIDIPYYCHYQGIYSTNCCLYVAIGNVYRERHIFDVLRNIKLTVNHSDSCDGLYDTELL